MYPTTCSECTPIPFIYLLIYLEDQKLPGLMQRGISHFNHLVCSQPGSDPLNTYISFLTQRAQRGREQTGAATH